MNDQSRKAMFAKSSNAYKTKPSIWVDGVPLKIVVDSRDGAINVSNRVWSPSDKVWHHEQDIFSANEYPDSTGFQNNLHKYDASDLAKQYNGGKPFKNNQNDYLKIAKIAKIKSGIGLGAYKQKGYGKTQQELKKQGVPT